MSPASARLRATNPMPAVRVPTLRLLRQGGLGALVLLPVAVLLGWLLAGVPGAWGAGLGMAVPLVFLGMTSVVALLTIRTQPGLFGVVVLGSWLVKVIALIGFLWAISGADFYSKPAFFIAFALGTVGYLALESVVVLRSRVPYVEPESGR